MSLAYVILGLLQQQERTGYDLKTECFDDCIAHLWQADQAQIYRTLDKLEAQGLIVCTVEIQYDRPNRKVYHVTDTGKAELTQWLQTHQPLPVLREPLLVQLYFAAQLPDEVVVQLLEQELKVRQEKLAECEALQTAFISRANATTTLGDRTLREQKMHQLVLELMTQREQAYLNWLTRAIEAINTNSL